MVKWLIGAGAAVLAGLGAWLFLGAEGDRFAECRKGGGAMGSAIGGPFELTDESGARVTDTDVIDKVTLVYFGYTFCPDVCPTDAAKMSAARDLLAEAGHDVNIVFVTVDPQRDTPAHLAAFTDHFSPHLRGLTGSQADIDRVTAAWRVYAARADDDPDYYLIDHSAYTYVALPEQGVVDFFRHEATEEEIVGRTACYATAFGS